MNYSPSQLRVLHADLLQTFMYDPLRGCLRWKVSPSRRVRVGARAGGTSHGAVYVVWRGVHWSEARLVVFYHTKQFPTGKVARLDSGTAGSSQFHRLIYTLPTGRFIGARAV